MKRFDDFLGVEVDDGVAVVDDVEEAAAAVLAVQLYRKGIIESLFDAREIEASGPVTTPCSHWGNKWRGRQEAGKDAAGQETDSGRLVRMPVLPEGFTWSRNNPHQPGRADAELRQKEALVDAYVALAARYMAGHTAADVAEAFDESATLKAKKQTNALRALGYTAADIKAFVDGAHVVTDRHGEAYAASVGELRHVARDFGPLERGKDVAGVGVEESPQSHVDEWRRRIVKKLRESRSPCSDSSSPASSSSSAASSPAPSSSSASSSPALHPDLKRAAKFIRKAERIARCGWAGSTKVATHDGCVVVGKSGKLLVTHEHCDVRDCRACARRLVRATKDRLRPLLAKEAKATDFLLVTATQRGHSERSYGEAYDAVDDAVVKLRKSRWFKRTFAAGLAGLEATWSTPTTRAAAADKSEAKSTQLSRDLLEFGALAVGDDAFGASVAAAEGFTIAGIERSKKKLVKLRREQERLRDPTKDGSWWHVHVHMVLLPSAKTKTHAQRMALQEEFKRQWAACLGVDETECSADVEKPREALDEVVKYAVKGNDIVDMPTERLAEYLDHKEGRRFIRTFGAWYGRQDFADAVDEGRVKEAAAVDETLAPHALEAYAGHTLDPRDEGRAVPWSRIVWRSDDVAVAAARQWAALAWEAARKGLAVRTMVRATSSAMPPVPSHGKTRIFKMRISGDSKCSSSR